LRISDLQKKKHIYKKRNYKDKKKLNRINYGTIGYYTLSRVRYELVYLRVLKRILKQKHIRRKVNFRKKKFWFYLKPNYILTAKSTNARMGAGVGALVRVTIRLSSYKFFLSLNGYSVN
jgi:ribosomal protein L16/L10AE